MSSNDLVTAAADVDATAAQTDAVMLQAVLATSGLAQGFGSSLPARVAVVNRDMGRALDAWNAPERAASTPDDATTGSTTQSPVTRTTPAGWAAGGSVRNVPDLSLDAETAAVTPARSTRLQPVTDATRDRRLVNRGPRLDEPPVSGSAAVGAMTLALASLAVSDLVGKSRNLRVDQGRLRGTSTVDAGSGAPGPDGSSLQLSASATFDLGLCPAAGGDASGTVKLSLHATGTLPGADGAPPTTLSGTAELTMEVTATANDEARLVGVEVSSDGTVTGAQGSASSSLGFTGTGFSMGGAPGDPQSWKVGGQKGSSNRGSMNDVDWNALITALLKGEAIVSVVAGARAETHWRSGACLRFDLSPPSPSRVEDGREPIDLMVRAFSTIDQGEVTGRVTAHRWAGDGTVDPDGSPVDTPARFRVAPAAKGSIELKLELTSRRGIGRGEWKAEAVGYTVDVNLSGMTIKGSKCDGVEGAWHLTVGGEVQGGGVAITLSGAIDLQLGPDGSGPYTVHITVAGTGLPAGVIAGLGVDGAGKAQLTATGDTAIIDILDGTLAGTAGGAAGGTSLVKGLPRSPTGSVAIPLTAGCPAAGA